MNEPPDAPDAPSSRTAESAPVGAGDLLRQALVNDDDPRFPWWLPLPGVGLAIVWAGYRAAAASIDPASAPLEVFLTTLLWPGVAVFLLTTAATWAGWQLEID